MDSSDTTQDINVKDIQFKPLLLYPYISDREELLIVKDKDSGKTFNNKEHKLVFHVDRFINLHNLRKLTSLGTNKKLNIKEGLSSSKNAPVIDILKDGTFIYSKPLTILPYNPEILAKDTIGMMNVKISSYKHIQTKDLLNQVVSRDTGIVSNIYTDILTSNNIPQGDVEIDDIFKEACTEMRKLKGGENFVSYIFTVIQIQLNSLLYMYYSYYSGAYSAEDYIKSCGTSNINLLYIFTHKFIDNIFTMFTNPGSSFHKYYKVMYKVVRDRGLILPDRDVFILSALTVETSLNKLMNPDLLSLSGQDNPCVLCSIFVENYRQAYFSMFKNTFFYSLYSERCNIHMIKDTIKRVIKGVKKLSESNDTKTIEKQIYEITKDELEVSGLEGLGDTLIQKYKVLSVTVLEMFKAVYQHTMKRSVQKLLYETTNLLGGVMVDMLFDEMLKSKYKSSDLIYYNYRKPIDKLDEKIVNRYGRLTMSEISGMRTTNDDIESILYNYAESVFKYNYAFRIIRAESHRNVERPKIGLASIIEEYNKSKFIMFNTIADSGSYFELNDFLESVHKLLEGMKENQIGSPG